MKQVLWHQMPLSLSRNTFQVTETEKSFKQPVELE